MFKLGNTTVSVNFDSGSYIGSFSLENELLPFDYRRDKDLWRALEMAICATIDPIIKNNRLSKTFLIGDVIVRKDIKNSEPLKIINRKYDYYEVYSKEKDMTYNLSFEQLDKCELYKGNINETK